MMPDIAVVPRLKPNHKFVYFSFSIGNENTCMCASLALLISVSHHVQTHSIHMFTATARHPAQPVREKFLPDVVRFVVRFFFFFRQLYTTDYSLFNSMTSTVPTISSSQEVIQTRAC
jgi:hypothetical protein